MVAASEDQELENRDNTVNGEWSDAVRADPNVKDDTETDDVVEAVSYRISSYGVDFDVEGLVRRINEEDIFVPDFQRGFVWTQKEASQFIESLLLGLPVPGIFLTLEPDTEKMMVVDGQQRLKTLQYFYAGEFGESGRPFALQGVDAAFEGKNIGDLREPDRRRLNNSLFHATITRQLFPKEGKSSVFHIFQRLNSTGRRLNPQEIRQAIYRGSLLNTIRELNDNSDWRAIYGLGKSRRQKDQELILRFWAMYHRHPEYRAPMYGFLNAFTEDCRKADGKFLENGKWLFAETMQIFNTALQRQAFRTEDSRQLNAAVFDSMSVGLALRIAKSGAPGPEAVKATHIALLADAAYVSSVSGGTAQESAVRTRFAKAIQAFEAA